MSEAIAQWGSEEGPELTLVRGPLPPGAWHDGDPVIGFDQSAEIIPITGREKDAEITETIPIDEQDITLWIAHASSEELARHLKQNPPSSRYQQRFPSPLEFNGVIYARK